MSIAVRFYNLSKAENSTKRPTGDGTSYNCVLKDNCSLENPVIELNTTPSSFFTYAYIPNFGKYYYVADWDYFRGVWSATMTEDVLATYKTEIGNSYQYIIRSASAYNKEIKDTMYPTVATQNKIYEFGTMSQWALGFAQGTYIAYINNGHFDANNSYGSLNYMTFTPTQFKDLLTVIYPESQVSWSNLFTMNTYNLYANALLNPIDYITKVVWIPKALPAGNIPTYFGYYLCTSASNVVNHGVLQNIRDTQVVQIDIPRRNDTIRGDWADCAPYGSYYLYWAPFGIIPIDGNDLIDADRLDCEIVLDLTSGKCRLTVKTASSTYGASKDCIFNGYCNLGIEFPIDKAKSMTDISEAGVMYAGTIASDIASGDFKSAVDDAFCIGSTKKNAPTGSGIGTGITAISDTIYLYHEYFDFVDGDNTNRGRPLMETRQVNTLSGYMITDSGDVSISATDSEKKKIASYLTGGFYYE